jgi:hypothetical protein
MRTTSTKRAIRNTFYRLGLHAAPKVVARALRELGIQVDEQFVRRVRFEMLKESTRQRVGTVSTQVGLPGVRHRPKGFPGRHLG